MEILTIGHSTRGLGGFFSLLKENQVEILIDARHFPHSRHNPQFNKEVLERVCRANGIAYIWMQGLGGFRKGGYERYSRSQAFKKEMKELERAARSKACIMCSEFNPYKCHRRYIADELKRKGWSVRHILDEKRRESHLITRKRTIKCDI